MTEELIMRKDLLKRGQWCECFIRRFLPDKKYLEYQYFKCKFFKSIGFPAYQLRDVWVAEARHKNAFSKKAMDHECPDLHAEGTKHESL